MAVTDSERYALDVSGYLVVPNAISSEQVATFNNYLDRIAPESIADLEERERPMRWLFNVDRDFVQLIDNETVLPYLEAWVDTRLRLDHAYALVHLPGEGAELHGGPEAVWPAWYRVQAGQISCGLTVVSYALTDGDATRGGFRVVPGSHKQAFPTDSAGAESRAIDVPVSAGDAVIFTEALVHGSAWHGPGSRRTLIVKYSPGTTGFVSHVWSDEEQASLTDRQRRMVLPPYQFDVVSLTDRQPVSG